MARWREKGEELPRELRGATCRARRELELLDGRARRSRAVARAPRASAWIAVSVLLKSCATPPRPSWPMKTSHLLGALQRRVELLSLGDEARELERDRKLMGGEHRELPVVA